MSLINQMLRDLESRRKAGGRELPSGEGPAVMTPQGSPRKVLIIVVAGLFLTSLVWAVVEFSARQIHQPQASVKQASSDLLPQRSESPAPPIAPVAEQQPAVETAAPVATPRPQEKAVPVAAVESRQKTAAVADARQVALTAQTAVTAELLKLGLIEEVASTRLMLEFERLPRYRWQFLGGENKQLLFHLEQTGTQAALKVPPVKGPLLKTIRLNSENRDLQLALEASQNLKLEIFELPADPFHGQRLMVELSRQIETTAAVEQSHLDKVAPGPAVESKPVAKAAPVSAVESKPVAKASPTVNRVNKKVPTLSPEERAEQAYRVALKQLQENENLAAETSLAHALTLQPSFVAARLQLIALLNRAGREVEAEKQLLQGLRLQPENPELRKGYARRLMDTGHLAGAGDILQSAPRPEVGEDLEYHALLAALQQELGQYQSAAQSYRQLLSFRPQEALWWAGLGISLEQSGKTAEAKEAYQRAVLLPGLRTDLQAYVNNRLQIL